MNRDPQFEKHWSKLLDLNDLNKFYFFTGATVIHVKIIVINLIAPPILRETTHYEPLEMCQDALQASLWIRLSSENRRALLCVCPPPPLSVCYTISV